MLSFKYMYMYKYIYFMKRSYMCIVYKYIQNFSKQHIPVKYTCTVYFNLFQIYYHIERSYINMYEAIRHGDFDSIESAYINGGLILPDVRDKYNKTPLMLACGHGRLDVAKYFIDKG